MAWCYIISRENDVVPPHDTVKIRLTSSKYRSTSFSDNDDIRWFLNNLGSQSIDNSTTLQAKFNLIKHKEKQVITRSDFKNTLLVT